MAEQSALHIIARIHSDFPTKFGIPRQSGLVEELKATIVFEPEYRNPDALRGLEGFSHLWLIWQFSQAVRKDWSPTVRPPRLGGNTRMGVFATRSPFRPNPIGLSCVGLEGVELHTPQGPVIHVTGADLMDGSPIYDIKPYIPYADCRPQAVGGFASAPKEATLEVDIPPELLAQVPEELREALIGVLAPGPTPHLSARPGAGVRHGLRRAGGALYGGRASPPCAGDHEEQIRRRGAWSSLRNWNRRG